MIDKKKEVPEERLRFPRKPENKKKKDEIKMLWHTVES